MQLPVERSARQESSGGIWCICDGCGIVCLCIAYTLLLVSNFTVLRLGRWPFGGESWQRSFAIGYEAIFVLSIWSHLACMLTDPGACPMDVEYAEGERHCTKCRAPKPARAHHCSTCRRCIMKMDHHCPWVNNCVGARNQKLFAVSVLHGSAMRWSSFEPCCLLCRLRSSHATQTTKACGIPWQAGPSC